MDYMKKKELKIMMKEKKDKKMFLKKEKLMDM